ncbi:MAG: hypothetical protein QM820_18950 [Minicystis sp.]
MSTGVLTATVESASGTAPMNAGVLVLTPAMGALGDGTSMT